MRLTTRIATLVTVAMAALALTGIATAKDKAPTGRELYKEYCKPCHTADSPNGEYTPMTLIQDQWTEFFTKNYQRTHKDVVDPKHDNAKVLELITPDMLKKIQEFAVDHAADSEHPMTCG
jgi:hypothetical protein